MLRALVGDSTMTRVDMGNFLRIAVRLVSSEW